MCDPRPVASAITRLRRRPHGPTIRRRLERLDGSPPPTAGGDRTVWAATAALGTLTMVVTCGAVHAEWALASAWPVPGHRRRDAPRPPPPPPHPYATRATTARRQAGTALVPGRAPQLSNARTFTTPGRFPPGRSRTAAGTSRPTHGGPAVTPPPPLGRFQGTASPRGPAAQLAASTSGRSAATGLTGDAENPSRRCRDASEKNVMAIMATSPRS